MAANPPIGNNFFEGVIGVVNVYFKPPGAAGFTYLGKTTADTEITIDQDIKDIIFQQDGTKYADKIRTGVVHQVNATFGEIDTELLELMHNGWEASGSGNSMKLGRSLYQSWKDSEAGVLKLVRIDSEGSDSTDPFFTLNFYKAAPEITGPIQYGADTQRNLPTTFHVFWDETQGAFGYMGNASSVGLVPA